MSDEEKIENREKPMGIDYGDASEEIGESGWSDYDILRGGEEPRSRRIKKIKITSISRVVKFYAVTSGLMGITLLLAGDYLFSGIVFASILIVYLLGRGAE
ncbi:MAG: hypothetical protein QW521_04375 [Desulfurococcaceae archaeon]